MLINVHLNPQVTRLQDQEERFDTLISPSSTIATLLNIEQELGENDIVGFDEAFPGETKTKAKIEKLIKESITNQNIPALLFTILLYNSERTIKYINELKKQFGKKIKIIVGGQLVPLAHKAYLDNKDIDTVCKGDAEIILPKLLKDLKTGNLQKEYEGWVMDAKEKKFAGVSFEHFFGIKDRMKTQQKEIGFSQLTIQGPGGPGCAWAISNTQGPCSFCALQNITVENKTSIEEYLENEKKLEDRFHPDRFFDVANQFLPTLHQKQKIKWLNEYIQIRNEKGIKAKKYAYLTVPSIDDTVASLLKKAGISEIYLGIDHFNEQALQEENKAFRNQKTLKKCLDALKKQDIQFRAGIVLGSAKETTETLESIRTGIEWMIKNYKDIIKAIGIFPIEILPGSKDFEKMRESGVCQELFEKFDKNGYLSRKEQREMTHAWIKHHSEISTDKLFEFKEEMFNYLKKEGVFGYSVDKQPEKNRELSFQRKFK